MIYAVPDDDRSYFPYVFRCWVCGWTTFVDRVVPRGTTCSKCKRDWIAKMMPIWSTVHAPKYPRDRRDREKADDHATIKKPPLQK